MKRFFSLLTAILLMFSLVGCIRKPNDALMTAAENMEKFNSLSYHFQMNVTAVQDGIAAPFEIHAFTRIMNEEGLMHMAMEMNLAGHPLKSETYRQQTGFQSVEYKGLDMGDGMMWSQESGSVLNIASVIPSGDVLKYISNVHSTGETTEIDGRNCTRYEGYIEGPKLKLLLKLVSLMGETGKEISEAFSGKLQALKVPVSLFLDTQEQIIIRIHLDGAELLEAAGILEKQNLSFTSAEISVEYGDFDAVSEILIPEEALNTASEPAA